MKRVIVSGGGTGGHIYPAVAVAEALRRRFGEEVEILFVGAEGKMEMEKVPALGYRIVGLPVAGLQRRFDLKNLAVPFKVLKSIRKARRTIRDFGADVVVGFGGRNRIFFIILDIPVFCARKMCKTLPLRNMWN